jgi:protein tyrosine phosphatase
MKIKERDAIFGAGLGTIIALGSLHPKGPAERVSKDKFAPNLLGIMQKDKQAGTEKIQEYFDKIGQHSSKDDKYFSACKKLIGKFEEQAKKGTISKEIEKTIRVAKEKFSSDSSSDERTENGYETALLSLSDLPYEIKHNEKKLKNFFELISTDSKLESKKEKAKAHKLKYHGTFPYIENRIAKLNASLASLSPYGTFILCASPKDQDGDIQSHFYETMVSRDCGMWFTLNQTKKENRLKFWDPALIGPLKDGWKVQLVKEETVKKAKDASIIKSTLVATKADKTKQIEHFHYDGWEDHSEAPSDELLLFCAKTACQYLEKRDVPLGINCKGGVGRTGVLSTLVVAMRHIQHELKNGKSLDDIQVNIPDFVYALRLERPGIVSHKPQFLQVYRVLNDYVKELRSKI